MKLSFAIAALAFPLAVSADDEPAGRIRNCYFFKYFGSGHDLSASGVADFNTAAGGEVHCHLGCASGRETTVNYNFDVLVAAGGNDGEETQDDCTMTTKFTAAEDQTQLAWSVTTPLNYDKMILLCYCTDDGTDFTLDNNEATIDEAKETVQNYISDAQDYLDANNGCFSESAMVQVEKKGSVAMKDLQLGDKVLTERNTYQPVYSFGHRKPEVEMEFYQIYTGQVSDPLEMTGNHMIMVVDRHGHTNAVRADKLQVGNRLLDVKTQKEVTVTSIEMAQKKGLCMPLTPNGKIVVNGVLASNYISISDEAPGVVAHSNWFFTFLSMPEQTLFHWWLSPYRMLCMGVSSGYCSMGDEVATNYLKDDQEKGILPWLLTGRRLTEVAEMQHSLVQMVLFGFPAFVLFGFFNLMETVLLGPSVAPSLLVIVVLALLIRTKKNQKKTHNIKKHDEIENEDLKESFVVKVV